MVTSIQLCYSLQIQKHLQVQLHEHESFQPLGHGVTSQETEIWLWETDNES